MPADIAILATPDGRQLEYLLTGPAEGAPLLFHTGTPGGTIDFSEVTRAAAALGLRTIGYSRPGYGQSTERRGRSVGDVVEDVTALLATLGVDEFVTLGWSGGGPHALACAALLPGRCRAAALLAGVAPYPAHGLDFLAGMDVANVEEFGAAIAGFDAIDALLRPQRDDLLEITGASVVTGLAGLLSDVDKAALTGVLADELALALRRAVEVDIAGWRDDDLAFASPWGFDLSAITGPVAVWQGRQDRMVPYEHGAWLAAEIPTAEAHLLEDEGHVSLAARIDDVLADLVRLGR
jgi:pimeloyl-ACP methyl ester carboxylesterase